MANTFLLKAATALANAFETITRDDGSQFQKLVDGAPQWMTEAVEMAHEGRMPNDYDYGACAEVAMSLYEAIKDDENLGDTKFERCEGHVPYATSELLTWAATNGDHVAYVNDAADGQPFDNLGDHVGRGMEAWYHTKWDVLLEAIEEVADADELEADGLDPIEYCDKCNAQLEPGQIGLCDDCQG